MTLKRTRILTAEMVREALRRYSEKETLTSIAQDMGVSRQALTKKIWPEGKPKDFKQSTKISLEAKGLVKEEFPKLAKRIQEKQIPKKKILQKVGPPSVHGDTLRYFALSLMGKAHRGTINHCRLDIVKYLETGIVFEGNGRRT